MNFKDVLTNTYYGNTVEEWLIAAAIIVASVIFSKVFYWTISRTLSVFTRKTKTQFDDKVVELLQKPAVFLIIATGIWYGLTYLNLPEGLDAAVSGSYQVLVALAVAWLLSRFFDAFIEEFATGWVAKTDNDLDDQLLPIIQKGVKVTIWSLAFIIGMNNAGYDVAALLAGLGIGGLALAMAAKDTVSNVFGGFTIFADQPFKIGDRIVIDGYEGTVSEIGVRSTRLKTLAGREVTIPNMVFAGSAVENVSREPSRKVTLNIGLTYDTTAEKMQQAMDLLKVISDASDGTDEKTWISFNAFGDFAMNICFVYYIKPGADIATIQSNINLEILRQFAENKLDMAFPTQTIYNINSNG